MIRFSKYLVERHSSSSLAIAFPGTPSPADLSIINEPRSALKGSLSAEDIDLLKELRNDLDKICERAKERGVKIIIDAEHR